MDIVSILLIAVGLAMDAFAVSICKGLAMRSPGPRSMLIIGLWFGGFQALMPVVGYLLGSAFYDLISDYDHWIAFGLLAFIGLNMIRESLSDDDEELDADIGIATMIVLAVATVVSRVLIMGRYDRIGPDLVLVPTFIIFTAGMLCSMEFLTSVVSAMAAI